MERGTNLKFKISTKLTVFFLTALLISTAVTGGLFCFLIGRHTTQIYKGDLIRRAEVMSRTVSRFYSLSVDGDKNPLVVVRGLNEISMAVVWLVNKDLSVTTLSGPGIPPHHHHHGKRYGLKETVLPMMTDKTLDNMPLPPGADKALKKAFEGETFVTEVFNPVLETKSLTVGVPVYDGRDSDKISSVLLLHSPIVGLHEAILQSIEILAVSAAAAFVIGIAAAVILSLSFTKPLKLMNSAAKELADGNYSINTGVRQNNELGELAKTLDTLAVRLKDASEESARLEKLRRDLVANVSHELRTPVTVLRGSLEAIIDGVITGADNLAEYNRQMLGETIHLQRLVNDLLELSRLQTVDFKIEKNPFDIKEAACAAAKSIQKTAALKNVCIKLEGLSERDAPDKKGGAYEPKIIEGDYDRVRQLFITILDNAVKFSPEGGQVTMRVGEGEISVTDHGSGISPGDLPHIFERFKKENSSRNKGGTGLGLAIAKEIARRHNFTLSAISPVFDDKENPGTTFTIRF